MHPIKYEDLIASPVEVMSATLDFIGVEQDENCCCIFKNVSGKFSKACSTHTFNSIIADFSKVKLTVTGLAEESPVEESIGSLYTWLLHFCRPKALS